MNEKERSGMINIYCDESCHLQYDNSEIMLLGGISCDKKKVKHISKKIRRLKQEYGLDKNFEIKWTKVSPGKIEFYKSLITLFFEENINFRCIIASGKKELDNKMYHQTYDDWYYKMYYLLLSKMLEPTLEYSVYIDIKDTNGGKKAKKLKEILNNFLYSFQQTCLQKLQIVKSDEIELLQLCDLLIGCVGYQNRFLDPLEGKAAILSSAKIQMCQYLEKFAKRPLTQTTPLGETKFNLFVWEPRK